MQVLLVLGLVLAGGCHAAPDPRFTCSECVDEMHPYLQNNYCPTLDDAPDCEEHLAMYYPYMLSAIVNHYFVDGAIHVCQTMGICEARRYTCKECVQGLEWVEGYLE